MSDQPLWMRETPLQRLRGEVAELIRYHDLPLLNGIPEPATARAIEDVGKVVYDLIKETGIDAGIRVQLLEQLLDAGLSPDARFGGPLINGQKVQEDGKGRSSLMMLCVRHGFTEGVALLIARGASIAKAKEAYGWNVLEESISFFHPNCARLILAHASLAEIYGTTLFPDDGRQAPFGLLEGLNAGEKAHGDLTMLELVLEAGMNRRFLLHKACKVCDDNPAIIDCLVKYGCDVNEGSQSPAMVAAACGKPLMLKRLLELGADPAARTHRGGTLMQCAGKHEAVKQVLRAWKTDCAIKEAIISDGVARPRKSCGMEPI